MCLHPWSIVARLVCALMLFAFTAGGSCYVSASSCFCEGDWCDDDCNTCSDSFCNPRCQCSGRSPAESKSTKNLAIRGYEQHTIAGPDGAARELLRAIDGPSMSPYQVGLAAERRAFVRALIDANPALFGAGPFVAAGNSASDGATQWITLFERADAELLVFVLDAAGCLVEIELPARSSPAVELPAGLPR